MTPADDALSGSVVTAQVTVGGGGPTVYASDNFNRTVTNNWGSAQTGGAYTLQGTAADYDVSGALGTISVAADANRSAILATVSQQNVELSFRVASDKAAAGGSQFVYAIAQRINAQNEYRAKLRFAPDGSVFVQASSVPTRRRQSAQRSRSPA